MRERHQRSIVKSITWRVLASLTTMAIVYAFTRRLDTSLLVGTVESAWKIVLYYLHERLWTRIAWGVLTHPLSDLPVTSPLSPEDKQIIRQRLQELGYL
jgi:uncharacterized membrane protein